MSNDRTNLLAAPQQQHPASDDQAAGRRLERWVGYALWTLAVGCLLLAALVWWRLLAG